MSYTPYTEMFQRLLHDRKFDQLSKATSVMHPGREVVFCEYDGTDVRLFKRNDTVCMMFPYKSNYVQENAIARSIETGDIFDDADTVDNHAEFIQRTLLPMDAMAHHDCKEPKKLKIVISGVIGRVGDDGRVNIDSNDMTNGVNLVKDLLCCRPGGIEQTCDHHFGMNKYEHELGHAHGPMHHHHESLPLELRRDIHELTEEIDSLTDVDDLGDDEITDADLDELKFDKDEDDEDDNWDDDEDGDDDEDEDDDDEDDDDEEETVQEAMAPSLVNVKNQLMKLVGSAFKFIGGSMVPKFTMQSTEKPEVAIDVTTSGNNVEATPKYNGMPDTMHKKKGIAFMQAADVIANFADKVVAMYQPKLATEAVNIHQQPKRLKPIDRSVIAFIPTEIMQIQDAHDQMVLVGYCASKLERVDFYLNCLDADDGRYIVPHNREYLLQMQKELTDLLQRILRIKPIIQYNRIWKPGMGV